MMWWLWCKSTKRDSAENEAWPACTKCVFAAKRIEQHVVSASPEMLKKKVHQLYPIRYVEKWTYSEVLIVIGRILQNTLITCCETLRVISSEACFSYRSLLAFVAPSFCLQRSQCCLNDLWYNHLMLPYLLANDYCKSSFIHLLVSSTNHESLGFGWFCWTCPCRKSTNPWTFFGAPTMRLNFITTSLTSLAWIILFSKCNIIFCAL